MLCAALVVALAIASHVSCYSTCLSCACTEDADCISGEACNREIGVCEEPATPCEAHDDCEPSSRCDFTERECTSVDVCITSNDCNELFVCDVENRHCVQDACDTDVDCVFADAPLCDVDRRICVSAEQS